MRKYLNSGHVTFDPTLHLSQEFITVAHHNNPAKAKLSRDKLTITLPINSGQYKTIQHQKRFWY